jgi:hypothetical protein
MGTNMRNAIGVLFAAPQIQVRKKAPQFHLSIYGGTTAVRPPPDVFSITFPKHLS